MPSSEKPSAARLPLFAKIFYLLFLPSVGVYIGFLCSPTFADGFNRTVAQFLRRCFAFPTSFLPFSFAEWLILLLPVWVVMALLWLCRRFTASWRSMLKGIAVVFSVVCMVFNLFVWTFAAGYFGTPLEDRLDLDCEEISAEELYETAQSLNAEMTALLDDIVFLSDGSSVMPYSLDEMSEKLCAAYDSFCERNDWISTFDSKIKPILCSPLLAYTHISGIYTYFTGEANINLAFAEYILPYTAAHEFAHQRGVAREEEANFVAFLVCMESDDSYVRYSALLHVWEYVFSDLAAASPELAREAVRSLPDKILAEEIAYAQKFEKYKDSTASALSGTVNDAFLKSQGEEAGHRSYDLVAKLAVGYYRAKNAR